MPIPISPLETIYYTISIIGGTLLLLGSIKKIITRIKDKRKESSDARKVNSDSIKQILSEFSPNHGSSLKDHLSRIDTKLDANTVLTEKVLERQIWRMNLDQHLIFETNVQGEWTWANNALSNLLKKQSKDFMGNNWRNSIHPDDREKTLTEWHNCVQDGRDFLAVFRLIDGDQNAYSVKCAANRGSLGGANGGYMGSLSIIA